MVVEHTTGQAILVGYSILCGVALIAILRAAWQQRSARRAWSAIKAVASIVASKAEAATLDEMGKIVHERMQQMAVEHVRWFLQGMCLCLFPSLCFAIYSLVTPHHDRPRFLSTPQDIVLMCSLAAATLVLWRPGVVTIRTLNTWYGVLAILASVLVAPLPDSILRWQGDRGKVAQGAIILIVDILGVFLSMARRPRLRLIAFHLLPAISGSLTILRTVGTSVVVRKEWLVVVHWALSCGLPLVLSRLLTASVSSGLRRELESQAAGELLSAAVALLRSYCDVVVELDPAGTIMGPAMDLAGFLLMRPGRVLQGSCLTELMPKEHDRAALLRHLRERPSSGTGLAEALHVGLRDVDRNLLSCELLSFKFRRLDGQPRYMVGLREYSDDPVTRRPLNQRQAGPARTAGEDDILDISSLSGSGGLSNSGAEVPGPSCEDSEESTSGPSRADSGEVGSVDTEMVVQQAAIVIVDCTDRRLPIRGYSSAFRQHLGRFPPGTSLAELIEDEGAFVQWQQSAVKDDITGIDPPDCTVGLETRQGRMKATCRLLRDPSAEYDLQNIQLLFFDIRGGRRSRKSRAHHMLGAPPSAQLVGL